MAEAPRDEMTTLAPGQAGRLLGWLLLGVLLTVTAAMLLPNREYYRWQQGDGTILFRARRVYERIHFDKRPIDVAMIGSSRMEATARADELSAGLSKALGRRVNVENFGLPQEGRDLNWAIAEEVLKTRPETKLIVLVLGPESVISHPGFRFLGDDESIIHAPVLVNYDYVQNMLTLPYRHVAYFVQGLWPWAFRLSPTFDPKIYKSLDIDPTKSFHMPYGTLIDRERVLEPEQWTMPQHSVEPGGYYDWKIRHLPLDNRYAIERHYTRLIAKLANEKHAGLAFLTVPTYRGSDEIYDDIGFFRNFGPIISASFVADDPQNYMDEGHLNRTGTGKITPWLISSLSPILRDAEKRH